MYVKNMKSGDKCLYNMTFAILNNKNRFRGGDIMSENKTRYLLDNKYFSHPLNFDGVYLIQIGRRYCEPAEIIAAHTHQNWFELTIITKGKGSIVTNGDPQTVEGGDIYLSFPCDTHEILADKDSRLNYDFFSFYTTDKQFLEKLKEITLNAHGAKSRIFHDESVSMLVNNAISEFSVKNQLFSKKVLTSIFHSILIYVIRDFNEVEKTSKNISDAEVLCYQMMNYVDTHIYNLRKLDIIAVEFNYNYSYLSKLFKNTTGQTLKDYFTQRKMDTAKTLIIENKKKIGEIAEMLGYDLYSFSKAFKIKFGVPPKVFQTKYFSKKTPPIKHP